MSLSNRSAAVQYDRVRGVLVVADVSGSSSTAYADLAALADAMAGGAVDDALLPVVAGYALALVARQHSGWPTESRRAALIQAAQQLRNIRPAARSLDQMLDAVLTRANDALLRGDSDIERILIDFVATQI